MASTPSIFRAFRVLSVQSMIGIAILIANKSVDELDLTLVIIKFSFSLKLG